MRIINKINDELIDISEYAKPNACFQTNEYPDSYDFRILHEVFNPFDIFNDNKIKDKEIERLNNIINELEKTLLEWHQYWEDEDTYNFEYKNAYDYLQDLKGGTNETSNL